MVMADTELNGARHLSLAPPPLTRSDLEPGEDSESKEAPAQAAPKRRGRPPGVGNGQGKKAKASKKTNARATEAKPAKKARAAKKVATPAPRAQAKKGELVRVRSTELRERAASGDVDATKLLKSIQRAHGKWTGALSKKATVSTECGQRVKGAEAAFTNAIEAPLPVGVVETIAYKEKLTAVEVRWSEWSDAKAQNIEEKKGARDDVKAALEALNEAIEESRQQRLPGMS